MTQNTSNPLIDLTNQRFGSLLVLERAPNYKSGAARWKCLCDCGKEVIVPSNNLRQGYSKSCGGDHSKQDNLVGLRFKHLVVLERVGQTNRRAHLVRAKCDCGKEWVGPAKDLKSLNVQSCGCQPGNKRRSDRESIALNRLLKNYKRSAKHRNHIWSLSLDEFHSLVKSDCHYCGSKPSCAIISKCYARADYNGIDRVNNDLGYEADNVVTCCRQCNLAKRDLTVDQFLDLAHRIYKHSIQSKCAPIPQLDLGSETKERELLLTPLLGNTG